MNYHRLPTEPEDGHVAVEIVEHKAGGDNSSSSSVPSAFSSPPDSPSCRARHVASSAASPHVTPATAPLPPSSSSKSTSSSSCSSPGTDGGAEGVVSGETPSTDPSSKDDSSSSEEVVQPPYLNIKRVGEPNSKVSVKLDWTVDRLKSVVCPQDYEAQKRIRMIFQGKILEDEHTLEDAGLFHDAFVHVVVTESRTQADIEAANAEAAAPSQADLDDAALIQQLRMQQFRGGHVVRPEGTTAEFVLGFFLGSFLGIIMFIWLWQPRTSRRQKLGILLGIMTNMFMGYISPNRHQHSPTRGTGSSSSHASHAATVGIRNDAAF